MKKLINLALVEFSMFDFEDVPITGNTAFLGPNGCGKTTLLDAVQIALTGAARVSLNSQAGTTSYRSVKDYCLGVLTQDGNDGAPKRKREVALSYIALTFRDERTEAPISLGVCISARADSPRHEVEGLFVMKGRELKADSFVERFPGGGYRSISWKDFEAAQRAFAKANGLTFETAPNAVARKYVALYLHYLQDAQRSIDVERYLSTLKESLHLKSADDIDSFVRNHLILLC